jgi:CheY-like chemotaxis protein
MTNGAIDILLAEDNEDDVLMIREAFDGATVANIVEVVSDGEQVMRYLRRQSPYEKARAPELMLLDINMPRKDGFEVLDEVKADPKLRHLPVVMLTTSHREEDVVRSYSHGACSYVTKPIDFKQFEEVVRQFVTYWSHVARVPRPA